MHLKSIWTDELTTEKNDVNELFTIANKIVIKKKKIKTSIRVNDMIKRTQWYTRTSRIFIGVDIGIMTTKGLFDSIFFASSDANNKITTFEYFIFIPFQSFVFNWVSKKINLFQFFNVIDPTYHVSFLFLKMMQTTNYEYRMANCNFQQKKNVMISK